MNKDKDNMISSISYFQVERDIQLNEKVRIKTEHQLLLYNDMIITGDHQYKINDVLDISCKLFSNEDSLLYLHTNSGMTAYMISSDPSSFIKCFRQLKAGLTNLKL